MKPGIQFMFLLLFLFHADVFSCDMGELYYENYDEFWIEWNDIKKEFEECSDMHNSTKFLKIALKLTGNSEVMEANNGVIENLTLKNPECMLRALHALEVSEMRSVLNYYLARPLIADINDIESALARYWNGEEYSDIRSTFLNLKQKIYN